MTRERRVLLALPAGAHGRPVHRQALDAIHASFPGFLVEGPDRRWDTVLTPVAAGAKLSGAHALVFAAWEGHVSRGVYELAQAARHTEGGSHWFNGERLTASWTLEALAPGERTRRRYARAGP